MLESIGNAPQFKDSVRRAQLPAVIAQPALAAAAPIERQAVPHAAEGKAVDLTCGCSNKLYGVRRQALIADFHSIVRGGPRLKWKRERNGRGRG
jgi:hypothetical protein